MKYRGKQVEVTHVIAVLLVILVSVPIIMPLGLPIKVGDEVKRIYDYIETIPEGSPVLVSVDITPSGYAETGPTMICMLRQLFAKNLRVIGVAFLDTGANMFETALSKVDLTGKTYGEDYVNLGFRAGGEPSITAFAADILKTIPVDHRGNKVEGLPVMEGIKTAKDIAFIFSVYSSSPGTEQWIRQVSDPYKIPIAAACGASQSSRLVVYVQSKQLVGLAAGLKGGADYEYITNQKGLGLAAMDAQSIVHLFVIGLIAVGNITYFRDRKKS